MNDYAKVTTGPVEDPQYKLFPPDFPPFSFIFI